MSTRTYGRPMLTGIILADSSTLGIVTILLYTGPYFFWLWTRVAFTCLLASMISLGRKTSERGLLDPGDCPTYRRMDMTGLLDGHVEITEQKIFG